MVVARSSIQARGIAMIYHKLNHSAIQGHTADSDLLMEMLKSYHGAIA